MNQLYLEAITTSVSEEATGSIDDNELYAFLDEEMIKFGSLREQDLDWQRAEDTAVNLLRDHSKHMRVLAHLAVCLQQSRDGERYLLSIRLINEFLQRYWESSQPLARSPERSLTFKRKILTQMLQRTTQFASRLDLTEGDQVLSTDLTAEVGKLEKNTKQAGVKYEEFWKIINEFNKTLPEKPLLQAVTKATNTAQSTTRAISAEAPSGGGNVIKPEAAEVSIPEMHFNASNEREVKQTLFKVATLLNSINTSDPLGYRVRRHALWFNIHALPIIKKDGTTEMTAVSTDRVIEYRDRLRNSPDEDLLQSIEHSVAASPFWLSGSYLSSVLARELGHDDISDAIRDETMRFTQRISGLLEARYSDGTGFADKATKQWLLAGGRASTNSGVESWDEKLQSALDTAKEGNYKDALLLLEKGTHEAAQLRDQFYWRLSTADFMENTGMKSIAREEYRSLLAETESISVKNWEPALIDLLHEKSVVEKSGSEDVVPTIHKES